MASSRFRPFQQALEQKAVEVAETGIRRIRSRTIEQNQDRFGNPFHPYAPSTVRRKKAAANQVTLRELYIMLAAIYYAGTINEKGGTAALIKVQPTGRPGRNRLDAENLMRMHIHGAERAALPARDPWGWTDSDVREMAQVANLPLVWQRAAPRPVRRTVIL